MNIQNLLALLVSAAMSCGALVGAETSIPAEGMQPPSLVTDDASGAAGRAADDAPVKPDDIIDGPDSDAPAKPDAKADEPDDGAPAKPDAKADEPDDGAPAKPDDIIDEPGSDAPAKPDAKADEPDDGAPAKPDDKADEPADGAPAKPDAKVDEPAAAGHGGAEAQGYSRLFTDNPVPDVAERCLGSVVGVINLVSSFDFNTREVTDEEYGYGSGVVIDDAGHIVTNVHVVQGADKLRVLLDDGSELDAQLVGLDSDTDLAVLHVEGLELEPVEIGDSAALRVGDLLIAIGNPGGYYGTVSVGIVSALERDIETFARPMDIIQTDAAMSPGISGGALLNADGELVGIPTLGVMLYEGLNFAIPSNTMREVVDELITYGKVRKPGMGIYYQVQDGPDEPLRSTLPAGLLVVEVGLGTPAEAAGMRLGDVIYEINGQRIKSARDLTVATQDCEAGDVLDVRVYRHSYQERPVDENFIDMQVTLEYIE